MFKDKLPTNSMYVLGLDNKQGEPTEYTCTCYEVNYLDKLESVVLECDHLSLVPPSVLIRQAKEKMSFINDTDYVDIDLDSKPKTIVPKNLVDIPGSLLTDLKEKAKELETNISRILLEQGSSALISFDKAAAYSETVLRDGLDIGAKIDQDITVSINGLLKLSLIQAYSQIFDLAPSIRKLYMTKMCELIVQQNHEDMKKQVTSTRHSAMLHALAGRVKQEENKIGVARGKSGQKYGSRHEQDTTQDYVSTIE